MIRGAAIDGHGPTSELRRYLVGLGDHLNAVCPLFVGPVQNSDHQK
jgi:hypothetical protein